MTLDNKIPFTMQEHLDRAGLDCPNCHASRTAESFGYFETEGLDGGQSAICVECDAEWVDLYKLVGYTDLDLAE